MTATPSTQEVLHRKRPLAAPIATACVLGAASLYTFVRNPFVAGAFPTCPLYAATGVYCPGCGGLRAAHELMHGHLLEALSLNALVVLGVIPVALVALVWWIGVAAGKDWRVPQLSRAAGWAIAGAVFAFSVLRNVGPLAPYLAP